MKFESWRLFFPTAAVLAAAGLAAWGAQLSGVSLGVSSRDHGAFMLWGALGSGVFGFLLTAYPKQNDATQPSPAALWALWGAQLAAAGALFMPTWPTPVRAVLVTLPWFGTFVWSLRIAAPSLRRKWDATTAGVPLALFAATVGALLHSLGSARGLLIGVHPFLSLLALAVLDRVLPFFSGRATPGYRGARLPYFIGPTAALLWLRVLVPEVAQAAELGLLVLLARQWWGWQPWPAARTPMIGAIHLGIAWMFVARALGAAGASASAEIHALMVGGLGTLLLAFSMRVVRGHGGMPVVLGRAGAVVLGLANVAALLRVYAALWGGQGGLLIGSATLLAAAFGLWLARFGGPCRAGTPAR